MMTVIHVFVSLSVTPMKEIERQFLFVEGKRLELAVRENRGSGVRGISGGVLFD